MWRTEPPPPPLYGWRCRFPVRSGMLDCTLPSDRFESCCTFTRILRSPSDQRWWCSVIKHLNINFKSELIWLPVGGGASSILAASSVTSPFITGLLDYPQQCELWCLCVPVPWAPPQTPCCCRACDLSTRKWGHSYCALPESRHECGSCRKLHKSWGKPYWCHWRADSWCLLPSLKQYIHLCISGEEKSFKLFTWHPGHSCCVHGNGKSAAPWRWDPESKNRLFFPCII